MDIVNPQVEEYMASLQAQHDEPVLLEMEQEGRERDFPIVGRNVGVTLEVLARSIGARRVMELGSGFGYSAYCPCHAGSGPPISPATTAERSISAIASSWRSSALRASPRARRPFATYRFVRVDSACPMQRSASRIARSGSPTASAD